MTTYKVFIMYMNGTKRTVKRRLSLEDAQKICKDPETSSSTCTKYNGRLRTRMRGPWFYAYTSETK